MNHLNFADATSYTFQNIKLWLPLEFMWNPIIKFLQLVNFLEIVRYCQNADTDYLRYFSDILSSSVFQILIVNCRWMSSTSKTCISTVQLQKSALYYLITSRSFTICSVNDDIILRSIMIKLESWKKIRTGKKFSNLTLPVIIVRERNPTIWRSICLSGKE